MVKRFTQTQFSEGENDNKRSRRCNCPLRMLIIANAIFVAKCSRGDLYVNGIFFYSAKCNYVERWSNKYIADTDSHLYVEHILNVFTLLLKFNWDNGKPSGTTVCVRKTAASVLMTATTYGAWCGPKVPIVTIP